MGDYIHVKQHCKDSYDISLEMWRRVTEECKHYNCYDVLGESYTDGVSTVDAYRHAEIFKLAGITLRHRIARERGTETIRETERFIETVLKNRCLVNGAFFEAVEDAKLWLLEENEAEGGPIAELS